MVSRLEPHDFIFCFIAKNVFLVIKRLYSGSYFQKPIKDRELGPELQCLLKVKVDLNLRT